MRAARAVWCFVALAPLLGRCSLVVGGFDVPACHVGSQDCEVLNRQMGLAATACDRWVCAAATQRCERTADGDGDGELRAGCGGNDCDDGDARRNSRAAEVCDGRDNNCNQIVDEGALTPAGGASSVAVGADVDALSTSFNGVPRTGVTWHVAGTQQQGVVVDTFGGTAETPIASLRYAHNASDDTTQPLDVATGCADGDCSYGDIAIDDTPAATDWFAAAIDTTGCANGRLRVGLLRTGGAQSGTVLAVGPASRSTSYRAIGTCDVGATSPAVARLREGPSLPRALTAWIAAPHVPATCDAAAPVQALGLWVEGATTPIPWVDASNVGAPQALGTTLGRDRPAVVSWHRAAGDLGYGWFVAWSDAAGGIALRFVPPLGDLPPFAPTLPAATPRMTPALDLTGVVGHVTAAAGVGDHLAMATGPMGAEGVSLGVAWLDACAAGSGNVWFARVVYQGTARTFTASPAVQLSTSGHAGAPALAYVDEGFVTGAFARGGVTAGDGADGRRGGWMVAWIDGTQVWGRRLAAMDGAPLETAPVRLRDDTSALRALQLVRSSPAGLRTLWFDVAARGLADAPLLCVAQ